MNALAPLPTRKDEDWRYSNVAAVQVAWPPAPAEHLVVGAGESAHRAILQQGADGETVMRDHVVEIGEGGTLCIHLLNIGGALGRVSFDVTLAQGAHFELRAALLGGGEQTIELVTTVRHAQPGATSQQTVRAIAAGKATTSYLGKIAVAPGAQQTDAAQSFKAMLLDRGASANARPELEIFADDVKCAHGASVGELDKTSLFYMASRGLDPASAKTLLLKAFIAGLFDDMADAAEHDRFEAAALAKLEAMG